MFQVVHLSSKEAERREHTGRISEVALIGDEDFFLENLSTKINTRV